MTLTVLNDDQIRSLVDNLTKDELSQFGASLAAALHEYSAGPTSSVQQPERTSIHNAAIGATTLFMPSSSSMGNSVKVITLTSPAPPPPPAPTSAPATTTAAAATPATIPPTGATLLLTPTGAPRGLLHARTLTAFRTALASLSVLLRRARPPGPRGFVMVVFGCGEQAYWHARLALLALDPGAASRVVFAGRSAAAEEAMAARFEALRRAGKAAEEGWEGCWVGGLGNGEGEDNKKEDRESRLDALLREADVVVCCTPSTVPLWPAGVWDRGSDAEGQGRSNKGRLVVAIGSYTPSMKEIPQEWVRRVMDEGLVIVDTVAGALTEAGELIEAGVTREQLVELGTLLGPRGEAGLQVKGRQVPDVGQCLAQGNVIYKSVGVGLMDLAVGMHLVKHAETKAVGTVLRDF
ncbi:hypothetical protein VTJ83DRAFT_5462 [Remersonia thermophila]|uniref:Ornithine cyclodeaminase n=1 Tax=Remersonia thermophila TaxID=72144 RepID=A0ABR4D6W9_9PEZI